MAWAYSRGAEMAGALPATANVPSDAPSNNARPWDRAAKVCRASSRALQSGISISIIAHSIKLAELGREGSGIKPELRFQPAVLSQPLQAAEIAVQHLAHGVRHTRADAEALPPVGPVQGLRLETTLGDLFKGLCRLHFERRQL